MSGDLCPARAGTNAAHCWHSDDHIPLSDPPQIVRICCYCGQKRTTMIERLINPHQHGPYMPYDGIVTWSYTSNHTGQ